MENLLDVRMNGANYGDEGFMPRSIINGEAALGIPYIKE